MRRIVIQFLAVRIQLKKFRVRNRSKCWINLEPCGLICGMVTWVLVGYGMFAVTVSGSSSIARNRVIGLQSFVSCYRGLVKQSIVIFIFHCSILLV